MCCLLNRFRWLVVPLRRCVRPRVPLPAQSQPKDKPADKPEVVVKWRTATTDEALRKRLLLVPEAGFDKSDLDGMYPILTNSERQLEKPPADFGPRAFEMLTNRTNLPEMAALPWIDSTKYVLTKEMAEVLRTLGLKIRVVLDRSVRSSGQADLAGLRRLFTGKEWASPKALPALTQILQIENADVRLVLVEALGAIPGEEASVALARRAIFDLSPKVREKAVGALIGRPAVEYTPTLITALRYPWPVVADHAAEAVAALKRTDVVPTLVNLLKEPDPTLPVKTESGYSVKEVVRLIHLCNCVLCHAPSSNAKTDRVRGRIVLTSERPPEGLIMARQRAPSSGRILRTSARTSPWCNPCRTPASGPISSGSTTWYEPAPSPKRIRPRLSNCKRRTRFPRAIRNKSRWCLLFAS